MPPKRQEKTKEVPNEEPATQARSGTPRPKQRTPKPQARSGKNAGGATAAASAAQPQSSESGKVQPVSTSQARSGKNAGSATAAKRAAQPRSPTDRKDQPASTSQARSGKKSTAKAASAQAASANEDQLAEVSSSVPRSQKVKKPGGEGPSAGSATAAKRAAQPRSPTDRKDQPAPKSQAPSGKKSTAKTATNKPTLKKQCPPPPPPPPHKWRPMWPRTAVKPGEMSGRGSRNGSRAIAMEDVPLTTEDEALGCGNGGTVWKTELQGSKIPFAIKGIDIDNDITSDTKIEKDTIVKAYKEVANQRKCGQASHLVLPVIAWTLELYGDTLRLLYAMPLCRGSVQRFIDKGVGIRAEFRPYMKLFTLELSEAVAAIHKLRVVHGDILAVNVFIYQGPEGYRVVLADFGKSVDYSDVDQVDAEIRTRNRSRKPTTEELEREGQNRDLRAVGNFYLRMKLGCPGWCYTTLKGTAYDAQLKGSERHFVVSLISSDGTKEPPLPAKHVKLLPFFQGVKTSHPDWALDLQELDKDHHKESCEHKQKHDRPAFANEAVLKQEPLMKQLRDGGKLKLRKQDLKDELAEQRTEYKVDGERRGIDEPCLWPNNIACYCPPQGKATSCPKLTLYSKEAFVRHAHEGGTARNDVAEQKLDEEPMGTRAEQVRTAVEKWHPTKTPSLVYAERIELCKCKGKKTWADVVKRDLSEKTTFVRACYCSGKNKTPPNWYEDGAVAYDALHLAELVDAVRPENVEPSCALINFCKDTENYAIGGKVERALDNENVVWTGINADVLKTEVQEEIRAALPKEMPSSIKR